MVRGIHSYHPFILVLYYILSIAGLMAYRHPIFLFVSLLLIIHFNYLLDNGRGLKKWLGPIFIMSSFILILTPLFNRRGNNILFYAFDNPVMLEGIIQGVIIALSLAGILAIFVTFNIVLTADKFLYLFAGITPQWALLIMLSMRFVPLLQRKLKTMEEVQEVKGLSLKQGSVRQRSQNGMQLLQMLLTGSLEDSIQGADSMTARGYGLAKRSTYQAYQMKRNDWLALVVLLALGGILFYGWQTNIGVLELLPEMDSIWYGEWQYLFLLLWIGLIGFPVFAEGKEVIKWKYYQRRLSVSPILVQKKRF